jgi:hypothetical protein
MVYSKVENLLQTVVLQSFSRKCIIRVFGQIPILANNAKVVLGQGQGQVPFWGNVTNG